MDVILELALYDCQKDDERLCWLDARRLALPLEIDRQGVDETVVA